MTEKQYDRLRDLLSSPAPDDVVVVDSKGIPFVVNDVVLSTEAGVGGLVTKIVKIVLLCERGKA